MLPAPFTCTYAELVRHDPHRRPDWRHERVLRLLNRVPTPGRCGPRDDEWTKQLRAFVLRWRSYGEDRRLELAAENPGLYHAYQIYERREEFPDLPFQIEARLLAEQTFEETAHETLVFPATVAWYEACFFNVVDALDHSDWILRQVLLPAVRQSAGMPAPGRKKDQWATVTFVEPWMDPTIKFFAYFAGPLILNQMLNTFGARQRIRRYEDSNGFYEGHVHTSMARRTAQTVDVFDINKFSVPDLFATYCRLQELAKSAELDGGKQTSLEANINALLRELPWAAGRDERRLRHAGSQLAVYDETAAELRDDEVLLLAAGGKAPTAEGAELLALPPPRPSNSQGGEHEAPVSL